MASGGPKKDYRTGETIYPADKAVEVWSGAWFLPKNYTCALTGTKLTTRTMVIGTDADGKKEIYLRGKEPQATPSAVTSVNDARVAAVPDPNMRTSDRAFVIEGNQAAKGASQAEASKSSYGAGAVHVETVARVPDSAMRTSDRKFNIAGKGDTRDSKDQTSTSQYGAGAVAVETVKSVPDPKKNTRIM